MIFAIGLSVIEGNQIGFHSNGDADSYE